MKNVFRWGYGAFFICLNVVLAAPEPSGRVVIARGDAKAGTRSLSAGDLIFQKDTLQTGEASSLKLIMKDRTIVDLGPKTQLVISKYELDKDARRVVDMKFESGQIRALVAKTNSLGGKPAGSFKIRTNSATMGVRGTEIGIQQVGNTVAFSCLEGKAEITPNSASGAPAPVAVAIEGGQKVAMSPPSAASLLATGNSGAGRGIGSGGAGGSPAIAAIPGAGTGSRATSGSTARSGGESPAGANSATSRSAPNGGGPEGPSPVGIKAETMSTTEKSNVAAINIQDNTFRANTIIEKSGGGDSGGPNGGGSATAPTSSTGPGGFLAVGQSNGPGGGIPPVPKMDAKPDPLNLPGTFRGDLGFGPNSTPPPLPAAVSVDIRIQ